MISAILPTMDGGGPLDVQGFRARVDDELRRAVGQRRADLASRDPAAAPLADELLRLIDAGGSRLRPICCAIGFHAGGGEDGTPIVRAAAGLEFLHLLALIHDDVMDDATERRGVAASHRHLAKVRPGDGGDPARTGRSLAILVGDLAGVCADLAFAGSGFPPERLGAALERYHAMRLDMAAGQALDVLRAGDPAVVARLKGGSYSIAGPLRIGAALASAPPEIERALDRFGEPLGTAFQLRDDLRDGDAGPGVDGAAVAALVEEARCALEDAPFAPAVVEALRGVAGAVGEP